MNTSNNLIIEFSEDLTEFERKINEEGYDAFQDGFEDEFYNLRNDAQDLYHECYDENDKKIVNRILKKLDAIHESQGMYNEKSENNGNLSDDFNADKYFGLD